jgi:hypothetical protein
MSARQKDPRDGQRIAAWGWMLIALGVLVVCSSGLYVWRENVWIGTVGAAGATAPSSVPLYLDALIGVIVAVVGCVFVGRGRQERR